jgi:cell division protein FtsI (penicillin-binding protein 3)
MTAAQMRKMMEGIVLYGTGRSAALDGYSAAGKTGTAQKIDPATHTYSKSLHVASFAGFAPVNNPAISVAVIIDSPKGAYYGAAVSAPVFQQVAQEVLEYLGIEHDIDVKPKKTPSVKAPPIVEDVASNDVADLDALYASVNDLPADDPLRNPPQPPVTKPSADSSEDLVPAALAAATHDETPVAGAATPESAQPQIMAASFAGPTGNVVVNAGKRVTVPDFIGKPVRGVIEAASAAGLDVEVLGSGVARQQAPAAGTAVPVGTEVIVRFTR